MKLRHIAAVVVLAAGTLAGGSSAPAVAAIDGMRIDYNFNTSADGSFGQHLSVTVMCRLPGWRVVEIGAAGTSLTSMRPTPAFDGAVVTALVSFGPHVTATIGCVDGAQLADVLHVEVRTFGLVGGFRDSVERCPAGMIGFGGGGGFSGGDSNVVHADLVTADGRGWEFAGDAPHASDSTQLDMYCAPDDGSTFIVSGGVASTGFQQTVRAQCPAGYHAFAGGAYAAKPDGSPVTDPEQGFFTESQLTNLTTAWEVTGSAPPGGKVVAVTRCTR
jgi:hypothetical protein